MGPEIILWMMLLAPPSFVTAVLGIGISVEAVESKKRKMLWEERKKMVSLNKKLDIYEEEIRIFVEIEDFGMKLREINVMVYEIENILEKESLKLEEQRIKYLNEQIKESKKVVRKYVELKQEEKRIIKPTVNEIIDFIEREVAEVLWKLKGKKHEGLRKKYEEKLEQIKNIKKE